jgi:hypothetical protein
MYLDACIYRVLGGLDLAKLSIHIELGRSPASPSSLWTLDSRSCSFEALGSYNYIIRAPPKRGG